VRCKPVAGAQPGPAGWPRQRARDAPGMPQLSPPAAAWVPPPGTCGDRRRDAVNPQGSILPLSKVTETNAIESTGQQNSAMPVIYQWRGHFWSRTRVVPRVQHYRWPTGTFRTLASVLLHCDSDRETLRRAAVCPSQMTFPAVRATSQFAILRCVCPLVNLCKFILPSCLSSLTEELWRRSSIDETSLRSRQRPTSKLWRRTGWPLPLLGVPRPPVDGVADECSAGRRSLVCSTLTT